MYIHVIRLLSALNARPSSLRMYTYAMKLNALTIPLSS